jgi:hypothetical protein
MQGLAERQLGLRPAAALRAPCAWPPRPLPPWPLAAPPQHGPSRPCAAAAKYAPGGDSGAPKRRGRPRKTSTAATPPSQPEESASGAAPAAPQPSPVVGAGSGNSAGPAKSPVRRRRTAAKGTAAAASLPQQPLPLPPALSKLQLISQGALRLAPPPRGGGGGPGAALRTAGAAGSAYSPDATLDDEADDGVSLVGSLSEDGPAAAGRATGAGFAQQEHRAALSSVDLPLGVITMPSVHPETANGGPAAPSTGPASPTAATAGGGSGGMTSATLSVDTLDWWQQASVPAKLLHAGPLSDVGAAAPVALHEDVGGRFDVTRGLAASAWTVRFTGGAQARH